MLKIILALLSLCAAITCQDIGFAAELGMYPWIVSISALHSKEFRKCGGALISDEWILTTAICNADNPYLYIVQVGQVDFVLADFIDVEPENFFVHPEHDYHQNNIALLRLPSPVVFSDTVGAISLPSLSDGDFDGTHGLYAGITVRPGLGYYASDVRYQFLSTISDNDCDVVFERGAGQLCAIGYEANPEQAPCNLADGSTLAVNSDHYTLIGLSSFAGCDNSKPVIFSRISHYLEWIADLTNIS